MTQLHAKILEANEELKKMRATVKTMSAKEVQRLERLEQRGQSLVDRAHDNEDDDDAAAAAADDNDEEGEGQQIAAPADDPPDEPPAKRRMISQTRVMPRPNPAPFNRLQENVFFFLVPFFSFFLFVFFFLGGRGQGLEKKTKALPATSKAPPPTPPPFFFCFQGQSGTWSLPTSYGFCDSSARCGLLTHNARRQSKEISRNWLLAF